MRATLWAVALMMACGLCFPLSAQDIEQSRGQDPRVDYPSLARYGEWDDRNYDLTAEDLEWLAPNEEELHPGIPVFFRVELRKEWPHLRRTGPAQYPRAANKLFEIRHGGIMRNGVIDRPEDRAAAERTSITIDGQIKLNDVLRADEITVEINPVDPMSVIAASNVSGGQKMYYSFDGGVNWGIGEQGADNGVLDSTCCDPTVGWSFDGTIAYAAALNDNIGVNFYRSESSGVTWGAPNVLTVSGSDKEFLHVDISPTSPSKDNVYLTWHDGNVMQFARSIDFGLNFTIKAFDGTAGQLVSAPFGIGSDITTDSAGNIYYLYASFGDITLLKSTNGGTSFQSPVTVAATNGVFDWPIPAMESRRAWIYAAADSDRSGGPFDGRIYCAWTDTSAPDSNLDPNVNHTRIVVARSNNGGTSWQTSIPHPAGDINTVDRFNQWLTVDGNGIVHVVFYDTRHSVDRTGVDLYYANSNDGGVTWNTEERISTVTSVNVDTGQEWGDYNGISVVDNRIVMTWTDNRPPESTSDTDVYTGVMALEIGGSIIWVDFAHTGTEIGTQSSPYNTLGEALIAVDAEGTIKIKGYTADSTSPEIATIIKAMRIEAVSGTVRIGVLSRAASGASAQLMNQLETLRASFGTEALATSTEFDDGLGAADVFSAPVLPFSMDGDSNGASPGAMAVRLRSARRDDAANVWSQAVTSPFINGLTQTSLTGPTTQDIWIAFRPDENDFLDGVIALTGAGPESPSDADELADAIGAPLNVGSERAYDKPLRVWLPLPADVPSNLVKLYYYELEGPDQGWRPAGEVEGWLVKDSEVRMTVKGTTYLGFLVRHAAIVQLAAR